MERQAGVGILQSELLFGVEKLNEQELLWYCYKLGDYQNPKGLEGQKNGGGGEFHFCIPEAWNDPVFLRDV
jgi:hypothetical protein